MPKQTTDDPLAGLPLYNKIGHALNEPGAVVPRGRVFGRGGGPETKLSWQLRAIMKVLADHGVNASTTFAIPQEQQFLIWSHDAGSWWGPNGASYTGDINQAGRYTLDDARRRAGSRSWPAPNRPPEVVVAAPGLDVPPAAVRNVMQSRIDQATRDAKAEAERQAWLARQQYITNPDLRQRVISAVDNAIANAEPGQADSDTHEGVQHTAVRWTWKRAGDTSVQKGVHADGADYEILVEDPDDPDSGPWVLATTRPDLDCDVKWMPGAGFADVAGFLDWFEAAGG